jgi:hypothetical protein
MTLNETDLQNLLTLIDFHDDYDEVKEVWGFDIGPLREKIVSELSNLMKVHVIFTRGTDYEANEELYALYSHKEDAESEAEKLRQEVVTDRDYNYLGRVYEVVEVYELKVH